MSTKRTYQPSRRRKSKTHGFRKRMSTHMGRKVIKKRLLRGRRKLTL